MDKLWNFCNCDGDDVVTVSELTCCASNIADYFGMSASTRKSLIDLGSKYWSTVDFNFDGKLNYNEFTFFLFWISRK